MGPIGVNGAAAAAPGCAAVSRVGSPADGLVVNEPAIENVPLDADAAQGSAVGAAATAERVVGDVDGAVLVLGERTDRAPAEVGTEGVAAVVDEARVDRSELATLGIDGPATVDTAVPTPRDVGRAGGLVGAVGAIPEGDVLHHDLRVRLIDAIIGGPGTRARVRVEDASLAPTAQGDPTAAIQHHS